MVKLLEVGMIYPISDSAWVSPVQVVPKKGGMTMITNEKNELIPTRTVTGWRMCIDYRRLNQATRKDHFPLPFMDQMLQKLSGEVLPLAKLSAKFRSRRPNFAISVYFTISEVASERFRHQRNHQRTSETSSG